MLTGNNKRKLLIVAFLHETIPLATRSFLAEKAS
jgi:hypothetical protein